MERTRLGRLLETVVIALFAGTISSVITVGVLDSDPPASAPLAELGSASDSSAEALARIDASISSLRANLESPQGVQREPVRDASVGETAARVLQRLEAFASDLIQTQEATNGGWTSVIDKSLVRCLVEYAKTPYSKGVAPILRQAARELAAVEDEFSEARRKVKARHKQLFEAAMANSPGLDKWVPPMGEWQALKDAQEASRERIITGFRAAVAALDS